MSAEKTPGQAHGPHACGECQSMIAQGGHRIIDLMGHAAYTAYAAHHEVPPWPEVREAFAQAALAAAGGWGPCDTFDDWAEAHGYANEYARDYGHADLLAAFEAGARSALTEAIALPVPYAPQAARGPVPGKSVRCPAGRVIMRVDYSQPQHPRRIHWDGTPCDHPGSVSIGEPDPQPTPAPDFREAARTIGFENIQLAARARYLRDALERCRDAAGASPAAVHSIASQALAGSTPEVMHLMTIDMGAWCGATQDGPGIFRASSQWRDVTCPDCTAKRTEWLLALVWDMLDGMGKSREALSFAVRAGRLGVTGEQGRPLAMACQERQPSREVNLLTDDERDYGADEDEQRAADLRAHVAGTGGPSPARVTDDAAGLGSVDIGSPEDGDHDDCEPTL